MKVKKGDVVQMLSGKDRGKQGRILEAQPRSGRVIVENLNEFTRHTKPKPIRTTGIGGSQMTPGGRIKQAASVPVSSVMLVCPVCHLPTRVGHTFKEVKGRGLQKVRVCRRDGCGQEID